MKKSILIFTLGLLLINLSVAGPIKITLYGKGGITHTEAQSKICPDPSDCVCTHMTVDLKQLADFQDGVIDVLPATIDLGNSKANILVNSMEQFEYDHNTVVLHESPELTAFKEWGLGKASGVTVTWVDPVQWMPYVEPGENPSTLDYIEINIKGQGGIIYEGGSSTICPQKNSKICAKVEGDFWDLLCYWFSNTPVSEADSNGVNITTYEDGIESHRFKGIITGVEPNSFIKKEEGGYSTETSTYKFKLVE